MEPAAVVTETAPSKEPQQSWRARPVESGAAAPTTSSKGELQMADQYIRDHFTLFLWIPTEQVGIVIGKKGAKIQYIQGATKTRVVIAAQPGDDWESAWFQVMVKGPPSGCYQAFKMISGLVDEVDDCVASFPIPRPKHSLVIGKNGTTIRTISADTSVRIYVPGKKEEVATNDIQLEGEVNNVMKCLSLIISAVYGGGQARTPTAAHATAAAKTEEEQQGEAAGDAAKEGAGKEEPAREAAEEGEEEARKPAAAKNADKAAVVEEEVWAVEKTIVVTLSQLRLLVAGKKNSPLTLISKATGAKIVKEPKARPAPPKAEEGEQAAVADGGEKEEEAAGKEGPVEDAADVAAVAEAEDEDEEKEEDDEQEKKDEEEEGEEGEEAAAPPADAAPTAAEAEEEAAAVADPEIKIFVKGQDSQTVEAAIDAILRVANGTPVKELIPEVRNRLGKPALAPGGHKTQHTNNNNGSGGGSSNKPSGGFAKKGPRPNGGAARQGAPSQGSKKGAGRGAVQVPRRGIQVAAKTT